MLNSPHHSLRKAAVFVRGLSPEAAETLYARLSNDEASRLHTAVAQLGNVAEEEHQRVVEEVRKEDASRPDPSVPIIADREGVALEIGAAAYGAAPEASSHASADWFACLSEAEPSAIAGYLASEQPRAIALVLSYVTPDLAASVLSEFPEQQQSKVLLQLANLGEADPTSVRVLATGLAAWIKRQQTEHRRRADRLGTVRAIVSALPESGRAGVVERIQQSEPSFGEELFKPPTGPAVPAVEIVLPETTAKRSVVPNLSVEPLVAPQNPRRRFQRLEDLERLDSRTLSRALGVLSPRMALLALAEASERLLKRVEAGLTRRATRELRQGIVRLGPTTLAQIDQAQLELLNAAERVVLARRATATNHSTTSTT